MEAQQLPYLLKLVNNLKEPRKRSQIFCRTLVDSQMSCRGRTHSFKSRLPALSSWLESTQTSKLPQHSVATAMRDTIIWAPSSSTCQWPSSSTPNKGAPWSEVVVLSQKKAPKPLDQGPADPKASPKDAAPQLTDTTAFPPLMAACAPPDRRPAPGHPAPCHSPLSPCPSTQRRRHLKDAVRWQTGRPHPRALDREDGSTKPAAPLRQQATTLVIGDSIIRNICLRGVFTLSFPGATVADITEKIPSVLNSHPQVNRVVIHVGTNDTSRPSF
ncbi:unnamed protein product [Xyrichtys novacula]|uniref:Unnamed protein product n=1 Tax=Xyrichtys novacula TaxID=13765 RepID=A0AAV1EIG0_XYRNO|nr:unnamed protein product [Xyrichtys novacula]